MKKRIIALGLVISMLGVMIGCGSTKETASTSSTTETTAASEEETEAAADETAENEPVKMGFSVINLSDSVVATMVSEMKELAKEMNIELSVNDCAGDPSAQISAVQNFVAAGCDVIAIQALDADAMAPVAKDAMDKGVKIIAYGIGLENYDCWYKNDNYAVGQATGKMAADWINENCDGVAKVALIEFPTVSVLIDRATGITDALKENCPGAEIVASGSAIDSEAGMKLGENFLQKDSEIQVFVSISDGPALGAYEAVKSAGRDNEDFAIFGSDTSPIAVQNILAETCYRGTVDCDSKVNAQTTLGIAKALMDGTQEEDTVVMGANPVTIDNAADYQ